MKLSDDFPKAIRSDPTRLRQVLVNFVGNAVKFTQDGEVRVEGSVERIEGDQKFIRIAVIDTGIGIASDTVEKLFTDFTQGDASITREFEGTGLGLSISKRLVELLGGEIGVESTLGKGSTFWFKIPYTEASPSFYMATPSYTPDEITGAGQSLKILVAEDNEVNQMIASHILTLLGHRFAMVDDGADAVEAVKDGDFDLVLMDIRMPNISGQDATRMIRSMSGPKSTIPIIALTADAVAENQQGYIDAGMDAVVTKPIDRDELAQTINLIMSPLTTEAPEAE